MVDAEGVLARLVPEADLAPEDDLAIRELLVAAFPDDRERYARRTWWAARPDHRLLLLDGERVVAHLGIERRVIEVGSEDVVVAGVGGLAVDPTHRGRGLGRRLTGELLRVLLAEVPVPFALLTCRPSQAAFYAAVGWHRLDATYRFLDLDTGAADVSDRPTFILPATSPAPAWPPGPLDLRGPPF